MFRFGKSGMRDTQSGARDEKAFMSMTRLLTVGNTRLAGDEWKVERPLPAMDNRLSDGNRRSSVSPFVRLQRISNICVDGQHRIEN